MSLEQEFKEKFFQCTSPSEITNLVAQYATEPTDFAPVTVPIPGLPNSSITYYVMKGYISVGNYPVPVDAVTAQYLAKKWNMHLPTAKMIDQITQQAAKTGGVIKITPLSSTGMRFDSGERISGEQIANRYIADPRVIDKHNQIVQDYVREHNISPESIMIGDQKILILPESGATERTHFKGLLKRIDPTTGEMEFFQKGTGPGPHPAENYVEYVLKSKLIKNNMLLNLDGEEEETTFSEVMQTPILAAAVAQRAYSTPHTYKTKPVAPKSETPAPLASKTETSKPSKQPELANQTTTAPPKQNGDLLQTATKWVKDKAEDVGGYLETKVPEWSKKIRSIFSQAEEYELRANASLRKERLSYDSRKNKNSSR